MDDARILIVDDEPGMLEVCQDTLSNISDVEVVTEQHSLKALQKLKSESWDMLITDIIMPEVDGINLLKTARKKNSESLVLMLTAFPSVETAVESLKLGATDYLTKPFLPTDLRNKVKRLLDERHLREENRMLRRQVKQDYRMGKMIGKCKPMQEIFDKLRRIADTNLDVLILGETGTGKELAARNIHQLSSRKNENFVPVDCGAIPEDLLESEFFGHEKGAFTGASQKNLGLLEFADKGTFFLDEIGQLPLKLQAKLLRVLQERKIRRVGGTREIDLDIRVIAATSLDLDKEIEEKRFRIDLYHRINVARIELPPLCNRFDDIDLLSTHFLNQQEQRMGLENIQIDPEVLEVFHGYRWPGNIRELQNVIKKSFLTVKNNRITLDDLPEKMVADADTYQNRHPSGFFRQREIQIAEFEKQYFTRLLKTHHGDVTKAAKEAGVPRGSLYRLLKKNNLDPSDFRS